MVSHFIDFLGETEESMMENGKMEPNTVTESSPVLMGHRLKREFGKEVRTFNGSIKF